MTHARSLPAGSVWLAAARPKTLGAAVAPVLMGTAMAFGDGVGHALSAALALLGALLIQIGTNFSNDYADFLKGADTHERQGPLRVTQAGLVSPEQVRAATILTFGLSVGIGAYLIWRGGWPVLAIGVASILSGVLYTAGPRPLGYLGLGDLFVLVFFGPVAVGGTYYVQALDIEAYVLAAGLAPGLLSVAILAVNNLRDVDQDRQVGKRTLAVRFGRGFARAEYGLCVVGALLVPVALAVLLDRWALLACLLTAPLAWIAVRRVRTADGGALNPMLGATGRLLLVFSVVFAAAWLVS